LAAQTQARDEAVLEVGCGTGRVGEIGKNPFKAVDYGQKLTHPVTRQTCRMLSIWAYERAASLALCLPARDGASRAGFEMEAVYGDFARSSLRDDRCRTYALHVISPHPKPLSLMERGLRTVLLPFALREKGPGDEGNCVSPEMIWVLKNSIADCHP
jgi:hypothetical protein